MRRLFFFLYFGLSVFILNAQDKRPANWARKINTPALKNFYQLNDSIYRSAQPDEKGFMVIDSMKIKSILSLRSEYNDAKLIGNSNFNLYKVGMMADNFSDKEIIRALRIIKNSPKPLLVHCVHGADRTGVVMAMYRIIYNGWTKEQALDEMRNGKYNFHESYDNIPDYIKNIDIEYIEKKIGEKD